MDAAQGMIKGAMMDTTTHNRSGRAGDKVLGPAVDYLGPATVADASKADLAIDVPHGGGAKRVSAKPAFSSPYEAVEGDVLLVIGGPNGYYAIGVLHGKGKTTITVPGDIDVHAAGGTLRLSGDKGVTIEGESVDVRAQKLNVIAGAVVEKLTTLVQRVSEMWSVRAGERHTVVDGASMEKAKTATILTEETMSINGKQIHLG